MVRIGITSDTHGSLSAWKKALELFEGCDFIFHAGDVLYHGPRNPLPEDYAPGDLAGQINDSPVPVFIARGNCDAEIDEVLLNIPLLSPYFYSCMNGIRILMMHGTDCTEEKLVELGSRFHADLVVFGHIHRPVAKMREKTVLFNPGSPSLPKTDRPTVGLLDTEARKAQVLAVNGSGMLEEVKF